MNTSIPASLRAMHGLAEQMANAAFERVAYRAFASAIGAWPDDADFPLGWDERDAIV